jgi:flagellar hook assembly protein FlgD
MKKSLNTIAAAALVLFLFNVNLSAAVIETKTECKNNTCEKFRVGMYRIKNSLTMKLLMEKDLGGRVEIRLLDEKGRVVHDEYVGKSMRKFGRNLNFSDAQDGNYTLEISNDHEKIVKTIRLSTADLNEVDRRLVVGLN